MAEEEEEKEFLIAISMELSGFYKGELPKEASLRRKLWNIAEDKGRLSIRSSEFNVYDKNHFEEAQDLNET